MALDVHTNRARCSMQHGRANHRDSGLVGIQPLQRYIRPRHNIPVLWFALPPVPEHHATGSGANQEGLAAASRGFHFLAQFMQHLTHSWKPNNSLHGQVVRFTTTRGSAATLACLLGTGNTHCFAHELHNEHLDCVRVTVA